MAIYNESVYTSSLREVIFALKDENKRLFDFDYPLNSEYKKVFEKLFINRNLMKEIGFTSIGRFKHELSIMLNELSPKYNKLIALYDQEIEPLLSYKSITKGKITNLVNTYSESRFNDTPNGKITSIKDGYLTNLGDNKVEGENESTNDTLVEGFQKEQIELLDNYKNKITNIYVELLNNLDDLFIKLY